MRTTQLRSVPALAAVSTTAEIRAGGGTALPENCVEDVLYTTGDRPDNKGYCAAEHFPHFPPL